MRAARYFGCVWARQAERGRGLRGQGGGYGLEAVAVARGLRGAGCACGQVFRQEFRKVFRKVFRKARRYGEVWTGAGRARSIPTSTLAA
eukprot:365713-Chlamydomonas_euryale.AAC.1